MTLFEQYPDQAKRLHRRGYTGIVEMSKQFNTPTEMARAMGGCFGSVIGRWLRGGGNPSWPSEDKARAWLKANPSDAPISAPSVRQSDPFPVPIPATSATTTGKLLMVAVQPDAADRVAKVLAMLGCEVVEI